MSRIFYPFILLLFLFVSFEANAQARFLKRSQISSQPEKGLVIQVGLGASGVKSDICGSPQCMNIGPYLSFGGLYKLSPYFSVGAEAGYIKLGASEKDPRRPLNVSFRSEVIEMTGSAMINLFDSYSGSGNYRSSRKRFVVPYAKIGGGFIYYTATSYEGQGRLSEAPVTYDRERPYPAVAPIALLGGGLRFRLSDEVAIAPELLYRITTTDYLDNIGARIILPQGGPDNNDHYYTLGVKLMYTPVVKHNVFAKRR
ncbi:outer membrane beta-barrel protein [Pontibacter harenae]|uniref:outer membrane beta-barrel protein n=1 Tax=Pontibacter harenae TaxID=2894083 RepID=UPI001E3DA172|nr:outer membrane beta-barrel protein [Pontibacter harenae]MCC9166800.1 porin family protein [Pontibacter harenae]